MRNYLLDPAKARAAASTGRIDTTGSYVGSFKHAKIVTSKKGTEGVEFAFVDDSGASADRLTLWTYNAQGESIMGLNMLNAIMTCLEVKELKPAVAVIEEYDYDTGTRVKKDVEVFPALADKKIGLLIQMEEYFNSNGDARERPLIWGCFQAPTGRTPSEVLAKATEGKDLPGLVERMMRTPVRRAKQQAPQQQARASKGAPADPFGDMDSDIPF